MRHRNKVKKLGRTAAHRRATLRNIARAMIEHHQIKTTLAKAKAARSYIERLVTYGKKDTVAARRLAFKFLQNHKLVKKLFDEIAPTFADRDGGYTRIIKLGHRQGDGAELAVLQFVGFEPLIIDEKKEKKKSAKKKKAKKEAEAAEVVEEKKAEIPAEKPAEVKTKAEEEAPEKAEPETAAKEETPAASEPEKKEEVAETGEEKKEKKKKAKKEEKPEATEKPESAEEDKAKSSEGDTEKKG